MINFRNIEWQQPRLSVANKQGKNNTNLLYVFFFCFRDVNKDVCYLRWSSVCKQPVWNLQIYIPTKVDNV